MNFYSDPFVFTFNIYVQTDQHVFLLYMEMLFSAFEWFFIYHHYDKVYKNGFRL